MAYNTAPGRAEYIASAAQTVFPFLFKIFNDGDIKVFQTPSGQTPDDTADLLTLGVDYTVVISGDNGGTITLTIGAGAGDSITLQRELAIDRIIEYQTNGDLLATTINLDQNYQTYLVADQDVKASRFISIPDSSQGVSTELPAPVSLNFLQWDTAATALINVDSLQADGFLWTAADVYTKDEVYSKVESDAIIDDNAKLWDGQTTTHDITVDSDYTLTTEQNKFGRIIITDTGVLLTTARNIIVDTAQKSFIVQNDTLQNLTFKTLAGTGIIVNAGEKTELYNDGVNVITPVDISKTSLDTNNYLHIQDQKTSGTSGGASISGSQTRTLNTVLTNTIVGASLSTNQITLPAGTYKVLIKAPAVTTTGSQARLDNITDVTEEIVGRSYYLSGTTDNTSDCEVSGIFTIASTKVFEVKHYTSSVYANGLGRASNSTRIEIYTDVEIWKVG